MLRCASCGYRAMYGPDPVAAVITREDDDRIWLLRRALYEGAGLWTFPGGYVELGEFIEHVARRETREEIGIDIDLGERRGVYSRSGERALLTRWPDGPVPAQLSVSSPARIRALGAMIVVIGTPSGLSLCGRSLCSQRETRTGSVDRMISS
jgi:8-oxo-dGTP pyrophosphatase MutT (NUDIX family)